MTLRVDTVLRLSGGCDAWGTWTLPYLSADKVPGTQKALENICEGKQGRGGALRAWVVFLPREIGLACQVAKVRAVTVLHALVPVTISTVGPVTV